ncbi:Arginine--tRNA ligase [archaeon HR01]|nr:Arginine--tRNA ligase [archaeon HR01]
MRKLLDEVRMLLRDAGVEEPRLEIPRQAGFGEVSCTSAFDIAKTVRKPPQSIAEEIASGIDLSKARLVERVEAVRPGYINFWVRWVNFAPDLLNTVIGEGERFCWSAVGRGKTVLVEHTSVNPNKALHIGHARNTCLGDSIARIYRSQGYRVVVANYIDDSGSQMADILLAFTRLGYSPEPPAGERFDEYCGRIYVEVNRLIESDQALSQEKRRITLEIEGRDTETFRLNRMVAERVLADQLKTCWRLGARYDILNRESDILAFNLWDEVFEKLKKSGAIYVAVDGPKKGCWLINLSQHPTLAREGDEVLVKSDGATTYVARDIAYAAWKLGLLTRDFRYRVWGTNPDGTTVLITDYAGDREYRIGGVDHTVNVVDARQRRPQEIVRYAIGFLGVDRSRYHHHSYEVVSLSARDAEKLGVRQVQQGFVHMSGRGGVFINVEQLLTHLKEKAVSETLKRHPDWSRGKVEETAEAIAVAALRYNLIRSDSDKMIVFDTEEAMDMEGDTGPYIQYAYARASRILEKADTGPRYECPASLADEEKALILKIAHTPLVVEDAARMLLVKKVVNHAHDLASAFNDFYEKCPVLTAEADVKGFRLAIVEAFRTALSSTANLIGIPLLEEM